jgi:Ribbon-helix-helix protein, copG family
MRTTLTLDDDVAAELERLQRERRTSLKRIINDALREGLARLQAPGPPTRFHTRTVDLGPPLLGDLDDVAAALEIAEGSKLQ